MDPAHRRDGKRVVGWQEFVALPEWGIRRLRAKLDTGARTSALHATGVEVLPGEWVRFDVVLSRQQPDRRVSVEAPLVRRALVRSSTGHERERLVVAARVRIGDVEEVIEVNLVSRRKMLYRMLLGRTALEGRFLVDPDATFLLPSPTRAGRAKGDQGGER